MTQAHIGTSGYLYSDWRGRFYPPTLPQRKWLEFYATRFSTVELNVTFYRLPQEETFRGWNERTPETFRFAIKGSRFITHVKRLKDVQDPLRLFLKRARLLREKLAVVLWQLPPSMRVDLKRLERFLMWLGSYKRIRHVLEIRHPSWLIPETLRLLQQAEAALCQTDWPSCPVYEEPLTDFAYVRRHGAGGFLYGGRYSRDTLSEDATSLRRWLRQGREAFVYFNNDQHAYAAMNARQLIELVRG